MSINSWREEYYPIAANVTSIDMAISHSLLKWTGLLPAALAKHSVYLEDIFIRERMGSRFALFVVNDKSCALCHHYYDESCDIEVESPCINCPLYDASVGPCDYPKTSPYSVFRRSGDPRPMIKLLEKALSNENAKGT